MKHIKSFNESSEQDMSEYIQEIKDICLELQDLGGYKTSIHDTNELFSAQNRTRYNAPFFLSIEKIGRIAINYKISMDEELIDVVERIKDYMDSVGFVTHTEINKFDISLYFKKKEKG